MCGSIIRLYQIPGTAAYAYADIQSRAGRNCIPPRKKTVPRGTVFKGGIYRVQNIETGILSDCIFLKKTLELITLSITLHSQYMIQIHTHYTENGLRVNQNSVVVHIHIKFTLCCRFHKISYIIHSEFDSRLSHCKHTPLINQAKNTSVTIGVCSLLLSHLVVKSIILIFQNLSNFRSLI